MKGITALNRRSFYSVLQDEPEILTVLDVSKILRVGKNAAYELVKNGKLSSIQVGRKIIIPKACLIDFLITEKNYKIIPRSP